MKSWARHPYMKPLVKSFENKKFQTQSKIILKFFKKTVFKRVYSKEDPEWIYISHSKNLRIGGRQANGHPKFIFVFRPKIIGI